MRVIILWIQCYSFVGCIVNHLEQLYIHNGVSKSLFDVKLPLMKAWLPFSSLYPVQPEYTWNLLISSVLELNWLTVQFIFTLLVSAAKMIPLFMMFAGGPLGSGKQWYSIRICFSKLKKSLSFLCATCGGYFLLASLRQQFS